MKLTSFYLITGFLISINIGCNSNLKQKNTISSDTVNKAIKVASFDTPKNYIVLSAVKLETSNKAQVKVMAYLKGDFKSKQEIEKSLIDLYEEYRHQTGYDNFTEPTVVGVYLFSSEKLAKNDPSSWTAMLVKGPSDVSPNISFNNFKINAALGLKDNVLSEDEIQLAKIKKLLSSRSIDMCDLNKMVNDLELASIRQADRVYPNYGIKHDEYADQLIDANWKKLEKKYKLTHDEIDRASMFASVYCK